jgi:hypothetical protein
LLDLMLCYVMLLRSTFTVGVTASSFGLGATLSNFFGQMVVEHFGYMTSLMASFVISLVPVLLFQFMPETLGMRTRRQRQQQLLHASASSPGTPNNYLKSLSSTNTDTSSSYGSVDGVQ